MLDFKGRVDQINSRILNSCRAIGHNVILLAATKYTDEEGVRSLVEAGIKFVGENRVQDAQRKHDSLKSLFPDLVWHMIGHLQRNKVKVAVKIFDMIQSVDTFRLAEEINKEAQKIDKVMPILLEVNVSGEESKFGIDPKDLFNLISKIAILPHVEIMGLMTMAPYSLNPEDSRPFYRRLKKLKESIAEKNLEGVKMHYLSMGMSNDFEVAISEGANIVRVGRALIKEG